MSMQFSLFQNAYDEYEAHMRFGIIVSMSKEAFAQLEALSDILANIKGVESPDREDFSQTGYFIKSDEEADCIRALLDKIIAEGHGHIVRPPKPEPKDDVPF